MQRSRSFRRWIAGALLAGLAGIGAAGCIAVPVGGYDGGYGGGYGGYPVAGPVFAPSVVIAPGSRGYHGRGRWYGRGWHGPHRRG